MSADLEKVRGELDAYRLKWIKFDAERSTNKSAKQPPAPNFTELAQRFGMSSGSTGLVSPYDLETTELGKSFALNVNKADSFRYGQIEKNSPYLGMVFQSPTLFLPQFSGDDSGDRFISWKTDDVSAHVPKFDDPGVKQRVLESWKFIKARDAAKKAAEGLVVEANEKKQSLKELFAGRKDLLVVNPPSFTWLWFGDVPPEMMNQAPEPKLKPVDGLPNAGDEFMRTTFSLDVGKVGYALDRAASEVYIIRMLGVTPFEDLWDIYRRPADDRYSSAYQMYMQGINGQSAREGFIREFNDYLGVHMDNLAAPRRQGFPKPSADGYR